MDVWHDEEAYASSYIHSNQLERIKILTHVSISNIFLYNWTMENLKEIYFRNVSFDSIEDNSHINSMRSETKLNVDESTDTVSIQIKKFSARACRNYTWIKCLCFLKQTSKYWPWPGSKMSNHFSSYKVNFKVIKVMKQHLSFCC